MAPVKLDFPIGTIEEWGDRLGLSKSRRQTIEAILAPPNGPLPRAAKKGKAAKHAPQRRPLARRKRK